MARIVPVPGKSLTTVRQALAAWRAAGKPDPAFAADLERIDTADTSPADPWVS